MSFKEGNLVRMITDKGDADVMRVVEDSNELTGVTICDPGNELDETDVSFDTSDLELVRESQAVHETSSIEFRSNTILDWESDLALHDQFNDYIISIIDKCRKSGVDERIRLQVSTEHYSGDDSTIRYSAVIGFDNEVTSNNLGMSLAIANERYKENKHLSVKAISHYKAQVKRDDLPDNQKLRDQVDDLPGE